MIAGFPCSAVIITRNEESNIARAISSLKPLFTDIIVVDSMSRDNTVDIAESCGARVVTVEWNGYGASRNYGSDQALHDWIFSLDADEEVDQRLLNSISTCDLTRGRSYLCKRVNHVGHRPIKFGPLHPEWKERLYHRRDHIWDNREVHEELIGSGPMASVKLEGSIIHHAIESLDDYKEKMAHYASLSARQWIKEDYKPGFLKRRFSAYYHFWKSYILQCGFLEGKLGLELSLIRSDYARLKIRRWLELKGGNHPISESF